MVRSLWESRINPLFNPTLEITSNENQSNSCRQVGLKVYLATWWMAKAILGSPSGLFSPKTSQKFKPWYPSDGSENWGNFPLPQLKLPPSTMIPPMEVPCPPIHLVADAVTMFAPWAIGWQRNPPAPKVLSTTNGIPCFLAKAATDSKSGILNSGLPIVSR